MNGIRCRKVWNIEKYIDQIKSQYPVVEKVETMFKEFHALLIGKDETKLDEYLGKYGASEIESFCNGIKSLAMKI